MKPNKNKKRWIATLPIFLFLAVGFFYGISPSPATALSGLNPSFTTQYSSIICNGAGSCVIPPLTTNIGDLLVATVTCGNDTGGSLSILSLVDSVGDLWNSGVGARADYMNNFTHPKILPVVSKSFYALSALSTTTKTLTLTLNSNPTYGCTVLMQDYAIQVSQFQLANTVSGMFGGTNFQFHPPFTATQSIKPCSTTNPCTTNEFFVTSVIGNYVSSTDVKSFTVTPAQSPQTQVFPSTYNNHTASTIETTESFLANPNNNLQLNVTLSCTDANKVSGCDRYGGPASTDRGWDISGITMAFSVGQSANNCYNIYNTVTGTKLSSGSTPIISNQTYFNWFWYNGSQNIWLSKIQVNVKSVSGLTGGDTEKLTLALYEIDAGIFYSDYNQYQGNAAPPQALNAVLMPQQFKVFTLTNNASPANYSLPLQFATNSGAVGLLVLTTTHNGVTVYNSTFSSKLTAIDSLDKFAPNALSNPPTTAYQTLPVSINFFTFNSANLNLFAQYVVPCGNSIFQTPPIQNLFLRSTTFIAPLNCTSGQLDLTVLNSLIIYWPVWLIPLFMSIFGIIGLFMGLIIGMGVGTLQGIVPITADLMMFMGVMLIMVRREI